MRIAAWALLFTCVLTTGCRRPEGTITVNRPPAVTEHLDFLRSTSVGNPFESHPWITHVKTVDLDRDGRIDILACDAKLNQIVWLRQNGPQAFAESVLISSIPAPVHVEAVDFDQDGDLDLLVAGMGQVLPNNEKIGTINLLENDGKQRFTRRIIAENVSRVTDLRAGDFNGDGRLDLAVAQFGYSQGEVRWLENRTGGTFESHLLLNRAGAINVCVADLTGDRQLDIAAVVSQESEEIHLFENNGKGGFSGRIIYGSTNEDYGSSGISLCDLNRDGRVDILYTNGDGFDYAAPGGRPWHGVQWLENTGQGFFRFHRVGNLPGAYSPTGVDLNEDGFTDIVAVSGFNDWANPAAAALVVFENDGHQNFRLKILARAPTHLMTCDVADLDGDGRPVVVTGGFHAYPPFDRLSRLTLWRRNGPRG
jgi:hypothetical protein